MGNIVSISNAPSFAHFAHHSSTSMDTDCVHFSGDAKKISRKVHIQGGYIRHGRVMHYLKLERELEGQLKYNMQMNLKM
jgi:hypothetical protein